LSPGADSRALTKASVVSGAPKPRAARAGRRQEKQWRLRAALGERAQQVERRRISPMEILEGEDNRLRPRPSKYQSGHRRQLPSA
jgi:hypothetical protein